MAVTEESLTWVYPTETPKNVPRWLMAAAVRSDGEVFMAARSVGSEPMVLIMAQDDGVDTLMDSGHFYVPVSWLVRNFPASADNLLFVARRAKDHVAGR